MNKYTWIILYFFMFTLLAIGVLKEIELRFINTLDSLITFLFMAIGCWLSGFLSGVNK